MCHGWRKAFNLVAALQLMYASTFTIGNPILPPFQIIGRLTFLTSNLTTRLIQKFMQNITSFVVDRFINTSSSRVT